MDILVLIMNPSADGRKSLINRLREGNVFAIDVATTEEAKGLIAKGATFDAVVLDGGAAAMIEGWLFVCWLRRLNSEIPMLALLNEPEWGSGVRHMDGVEFMMAPFDYALVIEKLVDQATAYRSPWPEDNISF